MPAALVLVLALSVRSADDLHGAWEGAFDAGGSRWPVRLELSAHRTDDESAARDRGAEPSQVDLVAQLDLPELGMIAEPVGARRAGTGAAVVAFPFGLGEYELTSDGGGERLVARALADSPVALALHRAPAQWRPYTTETVSFAAGDGVVLEGTLHRPREGGPHAGAVVLHGSATGSREHWEYRSWGPVLATMGLAALVYDRRAGAHDLALLAADAAAAHRWMTTARGIDAERVGFAGGSQAAWLGASVAARAHEPDATPPVAFLVMSGWPAVTPYEQQVQSLRNGMLDDGADPGDVAQAIAYTHLLFYVARTGELWHELRPRIAAAAAQPWGGYVEQPRALEDLSWWRRNMDFGGEADLRRVRCPSLALYGEDDWVVPPAENADRLVRALEHAGNRDVQVAVFADADHRGETPLRTEGGVIRWPRLAPGWHATIEAWLHEHGLIATG